MGWIHWSEPCADAALRAAIVAAVEGLDHQPLTELLALLGQVQPRAVYPATLPGLGPLPSAAEMP
jgi:2-methylcitrate dehydratase